MCSDRRVTVQLVQLNTAYGKQIYIPYSIGMLRAYSEQYQKIRERFEFCPFLYRRDVVESIVEQIGGVDILGLSCYVWNCKLSLAIAKEVRKRNPFCLIVVGGPHIPDRLGDFFDKYPFIDIACHGEGEVAFYEILKAYISDKRYEEIAGLSYHNRTTHKVTQNPKRSRIRDLDSIPSPYLNGVFDHLFEAENDTDWLVVWETNRGCPFSCSFCDWGSAAASKVSQFGMQRLAQEIAWFGEHKIKWVLGADANFGLLKRDKDIAQALAKTKRERGYPITFRVCYAKNSDANVFEIAKVLHEANISKSVSLSMQSLNPETLQKIRRRNVEIDTFHKLQPRYLEAGIATYTELILGLPGETYQSFVDGIDTLLDNGQHQQINIYNCVVMPNAELGQPEYQKAHNIRTIELPIFQPHSSLPEAHDTVVEYESIVIATDVMSVDDWRRMYHFTWAVQCFHLLGILQPVAIFLRNRYSLKYSTFYVALLQYGKQNPDSLIGQELATLDGVLDNVLSGIGLAQYLPQFSDIVWPPDEASFLRFSENIDGLYDELTRFLNEFLMTHCITVDRLLLHELLLYQQAALVRCDCDGDLMLDLNFNLHEYIQGFIVGKPVPLEQGHFVYRVVDNYKLAGDKQRFALEVVWYRHKGLKQSITRVPSLE